MKKSMIRLKNDPYYTCECNTEYGFAHVVTSDDLTIQCCLMRRIDDTGCKKVIDSSDCGYDDGICGDVNTEAFEKYGKESSLKFLLSQMRKVGVKIK
jgi:hypothetical protein